MNNTKKNNAKAGKFSVNPFVKALEDKKKIAAALQHGIDLSTLKGIKFVKPI